MMRFDIITIFPEAFESYLNASMFKRARAKKLVDIRITDLRDFVKVAPTRGRGNLPPRRQVDDRPYGGGPGMVLKIEPLMRALSSILKTKDKRQKIKIVLFSAGGKQFNAKMARDYAKNYGRIIMIAGHYEGVDERIKKVIGNWPIAQGLGPVGKLKIENLSVGPYVLTGGELPAMTVVDAVSRHIPGFLGKAESLEETRYGAGLPAYTRPEIFTWKNKKYRVPKVLLSGDHKKIDAWRKEKGGV